MPAQHLEIVAPSLPGAGFCGKLAATGDFADRNLPTAFVRLWDRWVAQHLAPRLNSLSVEDAPRLRFVLAPRALDPASGPMAGVVLASADRAGRRFPLTLAAPVPAASSAVAAAPDWFEALEAVGALARDGALSLSEAEEELARLPFPDADLDGEPVPALALWTAGSDLVAAEAGAPDEALDLLLGTIPAEGA